MLTPPKCCIQVALSINRATCCFDTSTSRYRHAESGVSSCTFGGKQAQTQPLRRNDSHNGCGSRPLLEWASFLRCSPARILPCHGGASVSNTEQTRIAESISVPGVGVGACP